MVPWKLLIDPVLTRVDLLTYAAASRLLRPTEKQLADATGLRLSEAAQSAQKLASLGHLKRIGSTYSAFTLSLVPAEPAPPEHILSNESICEGSNTKHNISKPDKEPFGRAPARENQYLTAYKADQASGKWTVNGLLGLFYTKYEGRFHLPGKSHSMQQDRQCVVTLVEFADGDMTMAYWSIMAMFSDDMKWAGPPRLSRLTSEKWVREQLLPRAVTLRGQPTREWRPANQPQVGVVRRATRG